MRQTKSILIILSITSIFLIIANIIVSSSYTSTGEQIRALEMEKQVLTESNQILERRILQLSSLNYLTIEAAAQGFVVPRDFLTITNPTSSIASSK